MSVGFLIAALWTFSAALGLVPGKLNGPPWVVAVCGCIFLCGSLLPVMTGTAQKTLGNGLIVLFAIAVNWVAFGPGERKGSLNLSLPFISISDESGEFSTRLAFGFSALILDLFVTVMAVKAVRAFLRRGT